MAYQQDGLIKYCEMITTIHSTNIHLLLIDIIKERKYFLLVMRTQDLVSTFLFIIQKC